MKIFKNHFTNITHKFKFHSHKLTTLTSQHHNNETTLYKLIDLLQSYAKSCNLYNGKQLHCCMLKNNLITSPLSITSLINMYSKCNSMSYALSVFETSKMVRNVYAYNAIISGFVSNNLYEVGFSLYVHMRCNGVTPDKFTFPCVIKCCLVVLDVKKVHGLLFKFGLDLDLYIGSSLVNCYLKFGEMNYAYQVFDEMPTRDVVLWNAMINGYVHIGEFSLALNVFRRMSDDLALPNNFTVTGVLSALAMAADIDNGRAVHGFVVKKGYGCVVAVPNALIDMYGKCKCIDEAVSVFDLMIEKDIFSWNTVMGVHEQYGDHQGTIEFFRRMLGFGSRPDFVTVTTVLPACSHLAALRHVKEIHRYMIVNGVGNNGDLKTMDYLLVNNALMDIYVKCGGLGYAYGVFENMVIRDIASWNIIITGYGMHGYGYEALDMFDSMCAEQIEPDEVTFVGVLSACSHAGLISRGREYLSKMDSLYGVVPTIEHYACVIDMLGRAGQLDEAYAMLVTMPIESNAVAWRAFLASCKLHGNSYFAKVAGKHILELEPEHCGNYILMSNVYGATGRYEDVADVRLKMREQNVKKKPGYSWIEVNNSVHTFISDDRDHPDAIYIYASLDSLIAPLCENGYVLDV